MILVDRPTLKVTTEHRSRDALHGRFGGGWQWKLGVQSGDLSRRHGHVIVSLLVFTVSVRWGYRYGLRRRQHVVAPN